MAKKDAPYIVEIENLLKEKISDENTLHKLTDQVLRGARGGLETEDSFEDWLKNRFTYTFTWLDKEDYLKALVRALWLAPVFAGTDFGSSRQRDMGQVWTDTSRGFLGEIAVSKFFGEKLSVKTKIDTRRGNLKEFLSLDISTIQLSGEKWKTPNLKISIKTSKFNARWIELPGKQIEHSNVFILAKVGILRHHFLAFLKAVSFLKNKLFVIAKNLGELGDKEAKQLWEEIPEFNPIPAYIVGYLDKSELNLPIHMINAKVIGIKNKRIAITQGIGIFSPATLRNHHEILELDPSGKLPLEITPIIKSLGKTTFLAHSGGLKYGKESWHQLIDML